MERSRGRRFHTLRLFLSVFAVLLVFVAGGCATVDPAGDEVAEQDRHEIVSVSGAGTLIFRETFQDRDVFPGAVVVPGVPEHKGAPASRAARLVEHSEMFLVGHGNDENALALREWRLTADIILDGEDEEFILRLLDDTYREVDEVVLTSREVASIEYADGDEGRQDAAHHLEVTSVDGRLTVHLDGELLTEREISLPPWTYPVLSGNALVDNIALYTFTPESVRTSDGVQYPAVRSIDEHFDDEGALNWWNPIGDVTWTDGAVGVGGDDYNAINGIASPYPVAGDRWTFTVEMRRDSEHIAPAIVGTGVVDGKPWGLFLLIDRWRATLVMLRGFDGRVLAVTNLDQELLRPDGSLTLEVTRSGDRLFWSLDHRAILETSIADEIVPAIPFAGFFGVHDATVIDTVALVTGDVSVPTEVGTGIGPEHIPDAPEFLPGPLGGTEHLERWESFANERSTASVGPVDGGEGIRLDVDMTANPDGGVHAGMAWPEFMDLSRVGGVAFDARAEGIPRAHISLNEESLRPDRVDGYFFLSPEWSRIVLPFNDQTFGVFPHSAGDGIFDYSRTGGLVLEVYGYDGAGAVEIRDIELLPPEAALRIGSDLMIHDFDNETADGAVSYVNLYSDGMDVEYLWTTPGGAEGSAGAGKVIVESGGDGYADLRIGTGIGPTYDGFSVALKGEGIPSYLVEFRELESDSFPFWRYDSSEQFFVEVPLNSTWVSWRFPFGHAGYDQFIHGPVADGRPGGGVVREISFLLHSDSALQSGSASFDQLRAWRRRTERTGRRSIGVVSMNDHRYATTVGDTLVLNFNDLVDFAAVRYESEGTDPLERAARRGDSFVLEYRLLPGDGDLVMQMVVRNVVSRRVVGATTSQLTEGLDIFSEIDRVTEETVRLLTSSERAEATVAEGWTEATRWHLYPGDGGEGGAVGHDSGNAPSGNGGETSGSGTFTLRSVDDRTLALHDTYVDDPERIAFTVSGSGTIEVVAGFLGLNAWSGAVFPASAWETGERPEGVTPVIHVVRYDETGTAQLPPLRSDGRREIEIRRNAGENDRFTVAVDETEVAVIPGAFLSYGRIGVAVTAGEVTIHDIDVDASRFW
jgi:hypothetical protein